MSFPQYPAYKRSGVDWLGQVPAHWEVRRLRYLCDVETGDKDTEDAMEGAAYPFYVRSQTLEQLDTYTHDCEAVLTAGDGAGVGKVFHHHRAGPFAAHQRVYILSGFRQLTGRFVFHYLRENFYKVALEGAAKSTVDSLRRPMFTNFAVAVPPADECSLITDFADRETAKIDALVAEQERLIELLKEKRQAVISHAVTKGLNPDAVFKDSGVSSLGWIPAHWSLVRLKHIVHSLDQGWSPQCEAAPVESFDDWGVLKVGCVNGGVFRPSENKALPPELEPVPSLGVREGDLLVSRANTRELVGSAATVPRDYPRLMLSDKLYRLRIVPEVSSRFVALLLATPGVRGHLELDASGASDSMLNITQSSILELPIAVPPGPEQWAIEERIESEVRLSQALEAEAERAIRLLQERRSALISAAVTGQIDVRSVAEGTAA